MGEFFFHLSIPRMAFFVDAGQCSVYGARLHARHRRNARAHTQTVSALRVVRGLPVRRFLEDCAGCFPAGPCDAEEVMGIELDKLNPEQRQAVETVSGPLLLLAGAGTGKTRVIVSRTANLVRLGIPPRHILAVTFTNKAAREMKDRIGEMLSAEVSARLTVCTFHSFCLRILRKHIPRLGFSTDFAISSEAYQYGLIRTIMSELGFTGEGCDAAAWRAVISRAKCVPEPPSAVAARESLPQAERIAAVYQRYQERLRQMDQVDFDDLLVLVLKLWEENPEVLDRYRDGFRYLMVDEYQDTNGVQFKLMSALAGPRGNLCVVGDDDQSIYAWRGADITNILRFGHHFPTAKVIRLEQNYRSSGKILRAANALIKHNRERHEKLLWSRKGEGKNVLAVRAEDEGAEAAFVADFLLEKQLRDPPTLGRTAVLFRSNHQSRALENALRRARIPYRLVGTNSFYQRKEILDTLSLLHACSNPRDDLNLLRVLNVPPRGIGDASIERLREMRKLTGLPLQQLMVSPRYLDEIPAAAARSVTRFHGILTHWRASFKTPGNLRHKVESFLRDLDYVDGLGRMYKPREDALRRRENVFEFLNATAEFEHAKGAPADLRDFLAAFALQDQNDREEDRSQAGEAAVVLLTVHAAKGLEFPTVIVVGLERGLFPHLRAIQDHTIEEERRLLYVALTRARDELVVTRAEKRRVRGHVMRRRPSPFLDELPEEVIDFKSAANAIQPASKEEAELILARMKAQSVLPAK